MSGSSLMWIIFVNDAMVRIGLVGPFLLADQQWLVTAHIIMIMIVIIISNNYILLHDIVATD
jgi:hypothetical protein